MHGPASYRIQVRGRLDASWSDRLAGMNLAEHRCPDGEVVTILVGCLPDQAALFGVLNALYELHLPVLRAEYVENEKAAGNEA